MGYIRLEPEQARVFINARQVFEVPDEHRRQDSLSSARVQLVGPVTDTCCLYIRANRLNRFPLPEARILRALMRQGIPFRIQRLSPALSQPMPDNIEVADRKSRR